MIRLRLSEITKYDEIVEYSNFLEREYELSKTTAGVVSILAHNGAVSAYQLRRGYFHDIFGSSTDARIYYVLKQLRREGYVVKRCNRYYVTPKFHKRFPRVNDKQKIRDRLYYSFGSVLLIDQRGIRDYMKKYDLPYLAEILHSSQKFENGLGRRTDGKKCIDDIGVTHKIPKRDTHFGQMFPSSLNIEIEVEPENDPIITSANKSRVEIVTIGYNEVAKHLEWLENYCVMHGQITEGGSVLLFMAAKWRGKPELRIAVQPGTESERALDYYERRGILKFTHRGKIKRRYTKMHVESVDLTFHGRVDGCVVPQIPEMTEKLKNKCSIIGNDFNALGLTMCRYDLLEHDSNYTRIILDDIRNRVELRNAKPSFVEARVRTLYDKES